MLEQETEPHLRSLGGQIGDHIELVLEGNLEPLNELLDVLAAHPGDHPEQFQQIVPHGFQAQWILPFDVLDILGVVREVFDDGAGVLEYEVVYFLEGRDF